VGGEVVGVEIDEIAIILTFYWLMGEIGQRKEFGFHHSKLLSPADGLCYTN
jgi:hypothetical protein